MAAHIDAEIHETGHPLGLFRSAHISAPVDALPEPDEEAAENAPVENLQPSGIQAPFELKNVLTWRLVCELVRRHPHRLWPVRTFPMDGNYDCLTIRDLGRPASVGPFIHLNRHGENSLVGRFDRDSDDQELISWTKAFWSADIYGWLKEIEAAARLRSPVGGLPPSTPSSISVRWIAGFLSAQLGSRVPWDARILWDMPKHDAPVGAEIRSWAEDGQAVCGRVWVLSSSNEALAVTANGQLLRHGKAPTDLLSVYRSQGRSVARLLGATAADLLS